MDLGKIDINRFLENNSSRHHYIPKVLIKGFTNSDGLLYVYDKTKNKILNNPLSPKGIFFEWGRNTLVLDEDNHSSVLEDMLYSIIDNDSAGTIKYFQDEDLNKIDFTVSNTGQLLFFLVNLFWRIPYSDFATKNIINHLKFSGGKIDHEVLRNDPAFQKIIRAGIFKNIADELIKCGKKGSSSINIHQVDNKTFHVIGDNPILFRKTPTQFTDFGDTDFLIALSSTRIYSSTSDTLEKLSPLNSLLYNVAIINQSVKYIACSNYDFLEKSVKLYESLQKSTIESLQENIFSQHNFE
jgi:hypothetical protein